MADAYARATGEVSAVSVHQGCGLTNAMTGIGEAAKSRTPMLVLSGDTPPTQKTSNFWIDQAGAVAALGAKVERIHSPQTAVEDAVRAFRSVQQPLSPQAGPLQCIFQRFHRGVMDDALALSRQSEARTNRLRTRTLLVLAEHKLPAVVQACYDDDESWPTCRQYDEPICFWLPSTTPEC